MLNGFLNGAPTGAMRWMRRRVPGVVFEEFMIVGRRSGKERELLLGLYDVGGTWYVGHPNGTSEWVRNLIAAGECTVTRRDGRPVRVSAVEVLDPEERERVVLATGLQPAPAGPIYRAARSHVRAVGRFFRITPIEQAGHGRMSA